MVQSPSKRIGGGGLGQGVLNSDGRVFGVMRPLGLASQGPVQSRRHVSGFFLCGEASPVGKLE